MLQIVLLFFYSPRQQDIGKNDDGVGSVSGNLYSRPHLFTN